MQLKPISAAGVLLAAISACRAQTVVYSTSFELPGFTAGTLNGQSGWVVDSPNAVAMNANIGLGSATTGNQTLRINANPAAASGGWAYYDPIQITPIVSSTPLVTVQFNMYIGTGTTSSGGWGMDIFSSNVEFQGRVQVNSANTVFVEDSTAGFISTGTTVARNSWHTYKMVLDFTANKYDVLFDNNVIADNFNFSPGSGVIGDFDFRHNQQSPANDFALFDDLSITVANPPPPPVEWNVDRDDSWGTGSNWVGGASPNSVTATAKLGTRITAPRSISLSSGSVTLDQLQFTSPIRYTLSGAAPASAYSLRLAGASTTAIQVTAGAHDINTDVLLDKNATMDVDAGASIQFLQKLDLLTRALTKAGDGTLRARQLRGSSLAISAGTVQLTGGGTFTGISVFSTFSITGGTLDLGSTATGVSTKLLIDYSTTSPIATVRNLLASGRVMDIRATASLAVGYAEASAIGLTTLDDVSVDSTAVLLRLTFLGDANLDSSVTLADFTALASSFGSTNAFWTSGDFNFDSQTNLSDFTALAANFGLSFPSDPARQSIPEPAVGAFIVLMGYPVCRRRK